jgi:P27 family predicted phage terminase small subunit
MGKIAVRPRPGPCHCERSLIMGLRGPAPKPTSIKRLEGNPGKRKLNELEPTPKAGAPECPDYLDEVARREWDRLTAILVSMKVLTEADYIALANLCQAYSTLMNAQKQMNKTGILYKSKSGYIQQSPLLGIIHTQTTIVNNLLREFGLTPSSRTRVAVVDLTPKRPNPFAMLDEPYEYLDDDDSQVN